MPKDDNEKKLEIASHIEKGPSSTMMKHNQYKLDRTKKHDQCKINDQ